jgi:hypothetical protein
MNITNQGWMISTEESVVMCTTVRTVIPAIREVKAKTIEKDNIDMDNPPVLYQGSGTGNTGNERRQNFFHQFGACICKIR